MTKSTVRSREHADALRSVGVIGKSCELNTTDKRDEANPSSKGLHYSIPTLLWIGHLCKANKTPFDLSRLSFAVFRAGLVKPSTAYNPDFLKPLQNISVSRNRGWSLDTTSSAEDSMGFQDGGRPVLEPTRQPVNAPGSPAGRAQINEGFARFLKTHSSPTHQRVTAGGRIVPMERPSAPPQFKLATDNSNGVGLAPAPRYIEDSAACRNGRLENMSTVMYGEPRNSARKPLERNASFEVAQDKYLLSEPFPNFYDGQTGQGNMQKATPANEKAGMAKNTAMERNVMGGAPQTPGISQNTKLSTTRNFDLPLPINATSQMTATQARQIGLAVQGVTSTARASANSQYPPIMHGSQQQTFDASQYVPNATSFALDGVSTAMSPDLTYNVQGSNPQFPNAGLGAYHGLSLGAHQAAMYPDLYPMIQQGFQAPPYASLPYLNQLSFAPPAYYASELVNTSACSMTALPTQSLEGMSTPLAAPGAVNTVLSGGSTQVQLQQELALAEADFNHATEMERTLDQYLAMHMDKLELQTKQALTVQRMQIVEARAAAKNRMNQLQQALSAEAARTANMQSDDQSFTSMWSTNHSHSANNLNVQAPTWLPRAGSGSNKAVKIQKPPTSTTTAPNVISQSMSPSKENMDRPNLTPVKPTTHMSEDPFTTRKTTAIFSPEKSPVDEWGARLGAAPPELERQQSEQNELLKFMASEAAQVSDSSSNSIDYDSDSDESWGAKEGRAPPEIEADHEKYLDAIRKDFGATSILHLSAGPTVTVQGQNYKEPALTVMTSEFEKDYWRRKPDSDQHRGTSRSGHHEHPFENIMRTPPQKSKQTEEWVNGVVEVQKPAYSGRAPWITNEMNLLSTKGEASVSLQDEYATSRTRGANGAAGYLRG